MWMTQRAGVRIACLLVMSVATMGCSEVMDALNAGENEREANEANRARFHQQRAEAQQRKFAPVLKKVKKPPTEPIVKLNPESPEGIVFAELEARLACRDDACRSEGLQRIRRHSEIMLPALSKLMSGQKNAIVVEALRLAGLFKVKATLDAVSRTLLLGDKQLQSEAIWTLGAIGDARGVEPLRRLGTLDNPPRVMAAICRSLGQIGGLAALKPIEVVFMQGTPQTRVECLDAAARIGKPDCRRLFERAIKDPRPLVSQLAAKHLRGLQRVKQKKPAEPEPSED